VARLTTNSALEDGDAVATYARGSDFLDKPEWRLVQRIVASPGFYKSPLLTSFLLYITEQKLRNRIEEISEFQIGVRALRRPSAYNPGDDNIVRNYARKLRRRLDEYFAQNPDERLRISVPSGSYIPEFEEIKVLGTSTTLEITHESPEKNSSSEIAAKRSWLLFSLAAFLMVATLAFFVHRWNKSRPELLYHQFWSQIFDSKRTTYIVPTDSGIAMLQDLSGQYIHLQDYVSHSLQERLADLNLMPDSKRGKFGFDRFSGLTSTANLNVVLRLAATPEYKTGHTVVRTAGDLHIDDLNYANAIFLGGPHANPWVELFYPIADFRIEFANTNDTKRIGEKWIVDAHPESGAKKVYFSESQGYLQGTYSILAFLPSIDKHGYVLLAEGENMAGTAAAAEFALNPTAMAEVLKKARLPDGTIGPFQLLLETTVVGSNTPEAHVIIERYGIPQ
jgi:hypothetical protein